LVAASRAISCLFAERALNRPVTYVDLGGWGEGGGLERGASRVIQTKGDDNVFTERLQHTPFTIMPAIRLLLLWATYPLGVERADLESVINI